MSIDYLQSLEQLIDSGGECYGCPGATSNRWHLSRTAEELREIAQKTANSRRVPVSIYRILNPLDTVANKSYLICKKIHQSNPVGEPRIDWVLVDTKQAAEIMRDVSQGPSPYFAASPIETFKPSPKKA